MIVQVPQSAITPFGLIGFPSIILQYYDTALHELLNTITGEDRMATTMDIYSLLLKMGATDITTSYQMTEFILIIKVKYSINGSKQHSVKVFKK